MRFDDYGLIITNESAPGCYGDSCAETSRLALISFVLNKPFDILKLGAFITTLGILRHPMSPWREGDTSDDQKSPLYYALSSYCADGTGLLVKYLEVAPKYRYAGLQAWGQAVIFTKIPWRWNDGFKKFEPMDNSSCDYLNFLAKIFYCYVNNDMGIFCRQAMALVSKERAIERIENYYGNDKENNQWMIELYRQAIETVWKGK